MKDKHLNIFVDTCNIALILFLNVMSQNLGYLPLLSHNFTLRRLPPSPLTRDVIYESPYEINNIAILV